MNFLKRTLIALMAVVMTVSMTACSGDTSWAAEYEGERLPAGAYILYVQNAYYTAMSMVDNPSAEILDQAVEEGKTAREWIQEDAQQSVKKLFAIRDAFKAQGLEITEEEAAAMDADLDSQWDSYGEYYEELGIQKTSMRMLFEANIMAEKLFDAYYGEGGEAQVTDEEIKSFTVENYALVSYIAVPAEAEPEPEPEESENAEDAAPAESVQEPEYPQEAFGEAVAQGYLSRIQAGEDFYAVALEHLNTSLNEDEQIQELDESMKPELLVKKGSYTYAPAAMVDKAFELKVGETGMAEDESFFYLLRRMDLSGEDDFFTEHHQNLLYEFKTDEFHDKIDEMAKGIEVKYNSATIKLFKPEKLNLK